MYWPTTTAKRLHLSPSGLNSEQDANAHIIHAAESYDADLWATLTASTLTIWSYRPSQVVAALVRTPKSIEEYGANTRIRWKPDGLGIFVETDQSYLLLYSVKFVPQKQASVYSYIPSNGSGARSKVTKELLAPSLSTLRSTFAPGPGEGSSLGEGKQLAIDIRFKLVLRIDAGLSTSVSTDDHLIVATKNPPALQCIPWPEDPSGPRKGTPQTRTSILSRLDWIVNEHSQTQDEEKSQNTPAPHIVDLVYSHEMDMYLFVTSDGRAYCAHLQMDSRTSIWRGHCFHGILDRRRRPSNLDPNERDTAPSTNLAPENRGRCAAINARFSLLAVGLEDGTVTVYTFRAPDKVALYSHTFSVREAMRSTASYLKTGHCTSLAWSSDGHALATGWQKGWSIWSTFGKLMGCSLTENWQDASEKFSDTFLQGVQDLFWGPGNTELFLTCYYTDEQPSNDLDRQIFVLPFAKSAVTGQHSPDNTRYAFVQLDDSVLVYRGSDQPDMSIINPESDVWHHIKIPQEYLATNWPVRYACISSDGRLIAVAGRRGLTHFSTLSGRWKRFQTTAQEQNFIVEGGLQWYQHVLVAACHVPETDEHQIRLYSRDLNLDETSVLYTEHLSSAVILTSLFDNSLLVYTADNTLHHFLISITDMDIHLTLCGSITFEGVVGEPARVRGMSWLVPAQQQQSGDPMDDLMMATIIFLIDGKLVLLRPRRSTNNEDDEEVSYDMQILGDRIEYYWTHLQGVGTLENSLWGYDGHGIKLWLDALTIEQAGVINDNEEEEEKPEYRTIEESMSISLDFYPLCVLIEKGIIIGVEPEVSLRRSLEFAIFRSTTNTQLFLHHVLRSYLERRQLREAVLFASFYRSLVYFAHALEILLHDVLEEEADSEFAQQLTTSSSNGSLVDHEKSMDVSASIDSVENAQSGNSIRAQALLPQVIVFLDHFDESLDVVVNCARKTEVARWDYLFSIVGQPRELFEVCLERGNYKAAGSYLLVLHNLESLENSRAYTVRLLTVARRHGWHRLCKDLLRFTRSLDDDGRALRAVIEQAELFNHEDAGDTSEREKGLMERMYSSTAPFDKTVFDTSFDSLQTPPDSVTLQRTTSAPNILNSTILEEEDEYGTSGEYGFDITSVPTPTKRITPLRSVSLFTSGTQERSNGPPKASIGVNGRIIPASPSDLRRSSTSSGSSGNTVGGSIRSPSRRSPSISSGLGMSLSKVGLRSSDHVNWEGNVRSPSHENHLSPPPTAS